MASSIPQARNGTLYLMIGGRREIFDRKYSDYRLDTQRSGKVWPI